MPCQGPPIKRKVIFSVTSTCPSEAMTMLETNFFSCCSRRWAEAGQGVSVNRAPSRAAVQQRNRWFARIVGRRRKSGGWGSGIPEADFGGLALCGGRDFEELALLETQHAGKNIRGELKYFRVEVANDGVVVAAGVLDGVLNLSERILKRGETLNGAELGIGFR